MLLQPILYSLFYSCRPCTQLTNIDGHTTKMLQPLCRILSCLSNIIKSIVIQYFQFGLKSPMWDSDNMLHDVTTNLFIPWGSHLVDQHLTDTDAATFLSGLLFFEQLFMVRYYVFLRLSKPSPMLDSDVTHHDGIGAGQSLYSTGLAPS